MGFLNLFTKKEKVKIDSVDDLPPFEPNEQIQAPSISIEPLVPEPIESSKNENKDLFQNTFDPINEFKTEIESKPMLDKSNLPSVSEEKKEEKLYDTNEINNSPLLDEIKPTENSFHEESELPLPDAISLDSNDNSQSEQNPIEEKSNEISFIEDNKTSAPSTKFEESLPDFSFESKNASTESNPEETPYSPLIFDGLYVHKEQYVKALSLLKKTIMTLSDEVTKEKSLFNSDMKLSEKLVSCNQKFEEFHKQLQDVEHRLFKEEIINETK